jgi:hypothetical protein
MPTQPVNYTTVPALVHTLQELVSGYAADDATGIVTAAYAYRAGRAM